MRQEDPLLREAKKQARERALGFGNCDCECEIDAHDHDSGACSRKLRVRYYFHWKPGHPRLADPSNIMVVCSTCHSQILSARRGIY